MLSKVVWLPSRQVALNLPVIGVSISSSAGRTIVVLLPDSLSSRARVFNTIQRLDLGIRRSKM